MLRTYVLGGLLLSAIARSWAQTPALPASSSSPTAKTDGLLLTSRQAENVAALGQVWGFLKYYHPAVAAGQRDWDAEFLRQLPAVLACRSVAERNRLLAGWVGSLGPVPACATCATPPSSPVRLAPDLGWMQNQHRFSAPLRQQLAAIEANRYQGVPYYVKSEKGYSTAFLHEPAYAEQACPSAGLRLLAVCRYCSMVQYFYPYRYLLGPEWARVLPELLPRFARAATPLAYRHAALALFTRVRDGHARFYPPDSLLETERGAYRMPFSLQFLAGQAVVTHVRRDGQLPAAPVQPGDVVTHLGGVSVARLVRQQLPETPGSNRAAQLNTLALNLVVGRTPEVAVRVRRGRQHLALRVAAFAASTLPAEKPAQGMYRLLTPEIGYVDMAQIQWDSIPAIMKAFAHTKGIIVDQRNYPHEFVTWGLPYSFLPRPVPFATYARADLSYPGRFLTQGSDSLPAIGAARAYAGRLVVLVNEVSRSQAEFTAMALQATPRCTLVGSQTAGADGNVIDVVLPGGLRTLLSGLGIYYPDGRETQRVGLVPNVQVRPTVPGLRAGRDEVLERAVELLGQPVAAGA